MARSRWDRMLGVVAGAVLLACGGSGSGTQPPGPPSDLVKSGGDGQNWYFNNPLPTVLAVTAKDVSGRAVPGVQITWSVAQGGGAVSPAQSTTDASGTATTTDSIGSSTVQMINATFTGFAGLVSFTETATTPPTTGAVDIKDNFFSPGAIAVQAGGTVTWTWSGATSHTLTFTSGPPPLPAETPAQQTGTRDVTFNTVGKYGYVCTIHQGMSGTVTVVH